MDEKIVREEYKRLIKEIEEGPPDVIPVSYTHLTLPTT